MNNKLTFQELSAKRETYKYLEWFSSKGDSTKVVNIKDDYLLNIIRKVYEKVQLGNSYPFIEEFQSYNNVSYKEWNEIFINEYLWRKEDIEQEYKYYLDLEIQKQSQYDGTYYGTFGEYGDIF